MRIFYVAKYVITDQHQEKKFPYGTVGIAMWDGGQEYYFRPFLRLYSKIVFDDEIEVLMRVKHVGTVFVEWE